jgi:hypothetical protein
MFDFRKGLFALAIAGLGLVGNASAQVQCPAGDFTLTGGIKTVRAEGLTEQINQFTMSGVGCTTTNTPSVTITVTSNASFSNQAITGTAQVPGSTDAQAVFGPTGAATNGYGIAALGSKTVQGVLINANTMQFTYAPTAGIPNGSNAGVILINNLRVNANSVPVGTAITVTAANSTGLVFTTAPTAQTAAYTQSTLAPTTFVGYANIPICTTKTTDIDVVGTVVVSDNFAGAFTSDADEDALENFNGGHYGAVFDNTGTAIATAINPDAPGGTATTLTGVRLAVTFAGLSTGINYYLPTQIVSGGLTLNLVLTASTPDGTIIAGGSFTAPTGNTQGLPAGQTFAQMTVASGVAQTVFYAVDLDPGAAFASTGAASATAAAGVPVTAAQLNLYEAIPSATIVPSGVAPTVTVSVVGNSVPLYVQFAAQSPAAVTAAASAAAAGSGTGILTSCNTTILFPYLINTYGYDTGISIVNATLGTSITASAIPTVLCTAAENPLTGCVIGSVLAAAANSGNNAGSNKVVSQNGSCTLTLWGTQNGTALAKPISIGPVGSTGSTSVTFATDANLTINAGQNALVALSTLGGGAAAGFLGYGVASCTFQEAHAFALSTDGKGDSNGYLGVVLGDIYNGVSVGLNPGQ